MNISSNNINIQDNNLSIHAKKVINEFINLKYTIIDALEYLTHDGFDQYGPESNLWDLYLYIQDKESSEICILHYHWEDWFDSSKNNHGYYDEPYNIIDKTHWNYLNLIKKIEKKQN